jgi:hypothetical protein
MKSLLLDFNFTNKIIAYVKDERKDLNILIAILTSIVSCDSF